MYTKQQINEMRDWCLDCQTSEDDIERVNESSDSEIVRLVERNFCGGIEEFLRS